MISYWRIIDYSYDAKRQCLTVDSVMWTKGASVAFRFLAKLSMNWLTLMRSEQAGPSEIP